MSTAAAGPDRVQRAWEAWADTLPSVLAGFGSARVANMIMRSWPDETELLLIVTFLLSLFLAGFQEVLRFLFKWEDSRIDLFERVSFRPFLFLQSFCSFLALQFAFTLLDTTLSSFTPPLLPHFLHLVIVFLGLIFFFFPYLGRVSERGSSGAANAKGKSGKKDS